MTNQDLQTRILNAINEFKNLVEEYLSIESQIEQKNEVVESKKEELSKVAHEERMREIAEEVLFPGEQKGPSQTRKLEGERRILEVEITSLRDNLNKIKTKLIQNMYNLPIPVDLDRHGQKEGKTVFPFFENTEFGETVINIMSKLLKMERLEFQGVKILPDMVVVESSSTDEGITKLASGIKAYRLKLEETMKVYEQIDAMVERVLKSDLYARILGALLIEEKMSNSDLAKKLGETERKVYDACYNLTRDRWTPNPLEFAGSGKWTLTISGEILANRLIEKHPEKAELEANRES